MPIPGRRSPSLEREREIYARVVDAMRHPEASVLLHGLASTRERRMTPRQLLSTWSGVEPNADAAWSMYIHVPYCKSICTFCNYKRLRVSSKEALDEYVDFIESEARLFAPALDHVTFGAIYVGGGTPSVLDAPQLDRLLGALDRSFRFHPEAQKNFEYDPMVMSEERFKVVHEHGFSRFSFGIQSIDVAINELHNRGRQARAHIDKQFELMARYGHQAANVDFLLGLAGTTPEGMVAEIEEVLSSHRPSEVSIYFLTPTEGYVARHFEGDYARFEAFVAPFFERMPAAIAELAERIGYLHHDDGRHGIRMSDRRPRKSPPAVHAYCDIPSQVHRPLYVLGFGDSARSRVFGRLHYRGEHDADDRAEDSPRYVGATVSQKDEMFGYLALVLRDGNVLDRGRFRSTFGRDVLEVFATPADKLVQLGAVEVAADALRFAPQSGRERLRDVLFFLPAGRRKQLAEAVARS